MDRFQCANVRRTDLPFGTEFKLTKDQLPKRVEEEGRMKTISYASAVGSLMHA